MSMSAARMPEDDQGYGRVPADGLNDVRPREPVRCVAVGLEEVALAEFDSYAGHSRFDLDVVETQSLDEARSALLDRKIDILLVGRGSEGAGEAGLSQLSEEAWVLGVPVMLVADGLSDGEQAAALRTGIADVLAAGDLLSDRMDQAVEAALRRFRGAAADQLALISNLQAENETLRRIAIRNMRLLKGQTMPLMSLSWRMMQGEQIREDDRARYAKGLARATRNVAGLIDDTVIVAATHRAQDLEEDVDLNLVLEQILRDDLGEIANSRAHVVVHRLPVIRARAAHMHMLFEELLLTAVRNGRVGRVPEIEIGAGVDEANNPIIWMLEKGLQLSARKQSLAMRGELFGLSNENEAQDSHAWSLCQRLVERNNGEFRISAVAEDTSRVTMRFPQHMQIQPGQALA